MKLSPAAARVVQFLREAGFVVVPIESLEELAARSREGEDVSAAAERLIAVREGDLG